MRTVETGFLVDGLSVAAEDPFAILRGVLVAFLVGEDAFVRDRLDVRGVELFVDDRVDFLRVLRPFLSGVGAATAVLRVVRAVA